MNGASQPASATAGGPTNVSSISSSSLVQSVSSVAKKSSASSPRKKKDDKNATATTTTSPAAVSKDAGVPLNFPPASPDPTAFLAPLKDDSSAYAGVARSCLALTQYAGSGSSVSSISNDSASIASSALFHDASYAANLSATYTALIECLSKHKDRRCRILAAKTLALLARSAYAKTRPSPLSYSLRDTNIHRLEDEVGTDVPVALVTAVLDDPDNGVSASSMEAIGIMTLTVSSTVGTLLEDEFLREMQAIAFCRPTPYAPSLRQIVDEDISIPQMELSSRIHENVLAPRLIQIVDRISLYKSQNLLTLVLPALTACLVHQIKTTPALAYGMDRQTYAKRWIDINIAGLVDTVVNTLIFPALEETTDGALLYSAALSAIRLAHVCPHHSWVTPVCLAAARALKEQLNQQPCDLETKLGALASLVICLRAVPFPDRTKFLIWMSSIVAFLPSTTMAPCGVVCPGVLIDWQGFKTYRRPSRIGLWSEIALSFFVDGIIDTTGQATTNESGRNDALKAFLASPTCAKQLTERNRGPAPILSLYDELLLCFATVAVDTGRRLRVTPDGTLLVADPEAQEVTEWIQLSWTVLTAFSSCVDMGPKTSSNSMEEEWSVLAAGQASYVRLVQEHMYMVGLLNPDTSVALKLTPNALPPQMLWDQMSESAAFLSKFFEAVDLDKHEIMSDLMDELIDRELKQGIPSHHMRMFLLSLAADNWVQGRVLSARKHFETKANGGPASNVYLSLRVQSCCNIVLALNPRRLVSVLLDTNQGGTNAGASDDHKKKRDPLKKLAQETVRVSVACIESMALTACEWRRRFGSSSDLKQIVSITVGILQGKVDEMSIEASMTPIVGPVCDAAVTRIQAFYEKDTGAEHTFPASELVTQPVKPKIKPLISPSKTARPSMDRMLSGHVMQLCRQVIRSRIEQCVASSPPADSLLTSARPNNWLRLTLPPLPESKDARLLGNHTDPLSHWGSSVNYSSSTSDAVALIAAYTPRRYFRYDGEEEFRLTILARATNITAVEFVDGLRMELNVVQEINNECDTASIAIMEGIGIDLERGGIDKGLLSCLMAFRSELKASDAITWELSFSSLTSFANFSLLPSVVFRNVKVESVEEGAKWVGEKTNMSGDASTATGGNSKSGEDDFHVTDRGKNAASEDGSSQTAFVTLNGEPLKLSPMIGLQPCPLVFFRDRVGDINTLRFFWFNLPCHVPSLKVVASSKSQLASPMDIKLAEISALQWVGEAIPGGYATKTWAFADLKGQRLFCVLAETDTGSSALHLRGDQMLLYTIAGTKQGRELFVAALLPGMALSE